jgi:alpha-beta hydrolase superfamily lysophospholipase
MASLVQDVWLSKGPRLRARRFAPWDEPAVRLVFCPDRAETLDDPQLVVFLESLARRLEVIAWEPRGQGASAGRPGPETLEDARRLVAESPDRWGRDRRVVVGGHGVGGGIALAAADLPVVEGAFAIAPSFEPASASADAPETGPARLAEALATALDRPPLEIPTLVIDERSRTGTDAERLAKWMAREPLASRVTTAAGPLLEAPWDDVVRVWVQSVGAPLERTGS